MKFHDQGLKLAFILLLAFISVAVYCNSLHGEFLIDDYAGIQNNNNIHDLKACFRQNLRVAPGALTELVRGVIWQFSGGRTFFFHLFNVIMHAGCVVMLFLLLHRLFASFLLAFIASLIFAVHPIHTEAVSWISGGPYVFSSFFYVSAVFFYVRSDNSLVNLFCAIICFCFCFLTGNNVVTLPFMFLAYDLFFRGKFREPGYLTKARILVLSGIILISLVVLGMFLVNRNNFIRTICMFKGYSYLIVAAKAFAYYLKILYLPLERGLYHTFAYATVGTNRLTPAFFISIGIIIASVILFFKCRRRAAPLSFGIAWIFIAYLPYSNLVPICNIVSERYVYLASAGVCLILAYLFVLVWEIINKSVLHRKILRVSAFISLIVFLSSYTLVTLKHNRDYQNIISYWKSNINNFPDGYMAYNNLAGSFYAMGEKEQAITYCWINLMINPKQPHVWCNLGGLYWEKNDLRRAEDCYKEALKVDMGFLPASVALSGLKKQLSSVEAVPNKKDVNNKGFLKKKTGR